MSKTKEEMKWKYVPYLYRQRIGVTVTVCIIAKACEPGKVIWIRLSAKYLENKMRAQEYNGKPKKAKILLD